LLNKTNQFGFHTIVGYISYNKESYP